VSTDENIVAPHGRDDDGNPLAPYGIKVDGNPRKSRRGAAPGSRGNSGPSRASKGSSATTRLSMSDKDRKEALLQYGALISQSLIGASMTKPVVNKLGQKQADALACDGLVLGSAADSLADGLIHLAQYKPGVLAWMDKADEASPYLQLAMVGAQIGAALVKNHMAPDPRMAKAARDQLTGQAEQMAQQTAGSPYTAYETPDSPQDLYEPQVA
jgi:hypothetical protein